MLTKEQETQVNLQNLLLIRIVAHQVHASQIAKTCTRAEALITLSEASIKLVYRETIEGFEKNNCILTLVYTSSSAPGFVGKEMMCRFRKTVLEITKIIFKEKE